MEHKSHSNPMLHLYVILKENLFNIIQQTKCANKKVLNSLNPCDNHSIYIT